MSWAALGAVAELLGALAVLATLIYLAVQVRHSRGLLDENRRIALSQVYVDRSNQRLQDIRQAIDSQHFIPILAAENKQDEEQIRRRMVHQLLEIQLDTMLYQHKLGLLEKPSLEVAELRIRQNWNLWQECGCYIHPYVQEFYDENVRDGG